MMAAKSWYMAVQIQEVFMAYGGVQYGIVR